MDSQRVPDISPFAAQTYNAGRGLAERGPV